MNENLDLTKILKGCPKGTELYSTVYGEVRFEGINNNDLYPIELKTHKFTTLLASVCCTKDGRFNYAYSGECILFPSKDQRDWAKFERFWDTQKVEKFDPKTLKPFDKVLVRDCNSGNWVCDLFSHIGDKDTYPYYCVGNYYRWCIPYDDDTKHLIGTSELPSKYYRYWEE